MSPVITNNIPFREMSKNLSKKVIKAVKNNDLKTIKNIYSNEIHIDTLVCKIGHATLAWYAIMHAKPEILKFAKESGADFYIKDTFGSNLFDLARTTKNGDLINLLPPEFLSREEYWEPDYDTPAVITYADTMQNVIDKNKNKLKK